jgi:hypothetical protein
MPWEYKTLKTKVMAQSQSMFRTDDEASESPMIPSEVVEDILNEQGEQDWELVNCVQLGTSAVGIELLYFFKRYYSND